MSTYLSDEGVITMTSATAVRDHVCGMDIETVTAAGKSEYKGQTYYFCGSTCKEKFDLKPEQYLCKPGTTPKSGHCCCG
jgi:Cu+-exporting ATPase